MSYSNYLNSKHWKFIRLANKLRNPKCRLCKSKHNINIHHLRYKKNGKSILFKETSKDLIFLCWSCHQSVHDLNIDLRKGHFAQVRKRIKGYLRKLKELKKNDPLEQFKNMEF